ncbi:MAG: HepT-like ribonuclease domain-containing protein [Candidatus Dormibacteria bacterium]
MTFMGECLEILDDYAKEGRVSFLERTMVQDAVVRRMEVLADAAGRLSEELRERHPAVPWRDVTGFRNVVAHAYMDVDMNRVWEYLVADLAALRKVVDRELGRSA